MAVTPQMQERLDKIDLLISKGFSLKSSMRGFYHILSNPEGKAINTISQAYKNEPLPGFSWIGFLWCPFISVQIRHWNYFWFLGIASFIFDFIVAVTNLPTSVNNLFGISVGFIYAYNFPYQRWLFNKSNKKEISVWKSILIGLVLSILVSIPGLIVSEIINPTAF
ncbi:hypothetical protein [Prochlorococcus sp. MIT 1300]|uniref:hypothetical protein n=1 Tax=Prochlorococcus sp. MIT 1300 TaxID=3096218 RepID=UPI002A76011E|nr:hypothetical protein [Prochlorococcus sp. MIT 1300]